MPRMSEAEKQKSHKRILDAAARLLRENGIDATSVADVMTAAGMTHGGFYRHFSSKEDLVGAALEHAAATVLGPVESKGAGEARAVAVDAYIADYLSDAHRRRRAEGCPLAALAGEALREDGRVREAAENAARRTACLLSEGSGGDDAPDDLGLSTLAVLMGSIVLARLLRDEEDAKRVLALGRTTVDLLEARYGAVDP